MKSHAKALEFLYGLQRHGIRLGLEATGAMLDHLGRPDRRFVALHVAGTNGKGATAAMAAAVLHAAGLRVGLYTSPHLMDFRERIRVGGVPISEERVVELVERVLTTVRGDQTPTFFEFTTVMAFLHFADAEVDVAVCEVGMGGRFDATNVLVPAVTAITNVSLDHEAFLGSTVAAIAGEKAGIIKTGIPVITGRLSAEAEEVIATVSAERSAVRYRLDRDFRCEGNPLTGFEYHGLERRLGGLTCPLPGAHQLDNAACALAMVEVLSRRGISVSDEAVRSGLHSVSWEGRLECVEQQPMLLLDGAHNPAAAKALALYLHDLRRDMPDARIILVTGMMRDKDRTGFFRLLLPLVDEVVLTQAGLSRAATVQEMRQALPHWPLPVHEETVPSAAVAAARRSARPQDIILVTGSLILVGEVKALLLGCELSPLRG